MFGISERHVQFVPQFVSKYLPDILAESESHIPDINIGRVQVWQYIEEFQSINRELITSFNLAAAAHFKVEYMSYMLEHPEEVFDSPMDLSEHHLYHRHRVKYWQQLEARYGEEFVRFRTTALVPYRNECRGDILQLVCICKDVLKQSSGS